MAAEARESGGQRGRRVYQILVFLVPCDFPLYVLLQTFMMYSRHMLQRFALAALTPYLLHAQAQSTYGNNSLRVTKDSEIVASAFPEVEGVDLIAPAFTNPESLPAGWDNGTSGPTDLYELGQSLTTAK